MRRGQGGGADHVEAAAGVRAAGGHRQGHTGLAQLQERVRVLEREALEPQQGGAHRHAAGLREGDAGLSAWIMGRCVI